MQVLCECDGLLCDLVVELPEEEYLQAVTDCHFIIVEGCSVGPSNGDILVEEREGYKIYQ